MIQAEWMKLGRRASGLVFLFLAAIFGGTHFARAQNAQCLSIFLSERPVDKIKILKEKFTSGSKNYYVAEELARQILGSSDIEKEDWIAKIGRVYRQIPKKDPNPMAAWGIGGRRLLDRVLTLLERTDERFAQNQRTSGGVEANSSWKIYGDFLERRRETFRIDYSASEVSKITKAIQSKLVEKQRRDGPPIYVLLGGSFINGKASLTDSDLDISASDPSLLRDLPELQAVVDSTLAEIRPDAHLKFEFHTEPASFYGQLNSVLIQVTAVDVKLLIFPPASLKQDGVNLRAGQFVPYTTTP